MWHSKFPQLKTNHVAHSPSLLSWLKHRLTHLRPYFLRLWCHGSTLRCDSQPVLYFWMRIFDVEPFFDLWHHLGYCMAFGMTGMVFGRIELLATGTSTRSSHTAAHFACAPTHSEQHTRAAPMQQIQSSASDEPPSQFSANSTTASRAPELHAKFEPRFLEAPCSPPSPGALGIDAESAPIEN